MNISSSSLVLRRARAAPDDIWLAIFQAVDDLKHVRDYIGIYHLYPERNRMLKALCSACRRFQRLASPYLFQSLLIAGPDRLGAYLEFVQSTETVIAEFVRELTLKDRSGTASAHRWDSHHSSQSDNLAALARLIGPQLRKVSVDCATPWMRTPEMLEVLFRHAEEIRLGNYHLCLQGGTFGRFVKAARALHTLLLDDSGLVERRSYPLRAPALPNTLRSLCIAEVVYHPSLVVPLLAHLPVLEELDISLGDDDHSEGSTVPLVSAVVALGTHLRELALSVAFLDGTREDRITNEWQNAILTMVRSCRVLTCLNLDNVMVTVDLIHGLPMKHLQNVTIKSSMIFLDSETNASMFARLCEAVLGLALDPMILKSFVIDHGFEKKKLESWEVEAELRAKVPGSKVEFGGS